MDSGQFDEGSEVKISMGYVNKLEFMLRGEITAVSASFPSSGAPTLKNSPVLSTAVLGFLSESSAMACGMLSPGSGVRHLFTPARDIQCMSPPFCKRLVPSC